MVLCLRKNDTDLFLFAASDSGASAYSNRYVLAEAAPNLSSILRLPCLSAQPRYGGRYRLWAVVQSFFLFLLDC